MLGFNFNHAGINSVMTHVSILSLRVRKNSSQTKQLQHTLDIGNMFEPTFGFENSQNLRNTTTKEIAVL